MAARCPASPEPMPARAWEKLSQVRAALAGFDRVVIAFSGGVDSSLLAKLARDALGKPRALAVTADSPSLSRDDLAEACQVALQLDLAHLIIATRETQDPRYQANTMARCYVCKRTLFQELEGLAAERGIPAVLYGAIGDDRPSDRPGQRAAIELRVRAPLQEAGLEKWEVRTLARSLGLPNWDRPQNACLASRIPHGSEVTEHKLRQIEQAEVVLRHLGFRHIRVRHLGAHARIEVGKEDLGRFEDALVCREIAARFEGFGFRSVGVDRAGYRCGGANASAADEVLLTAIAKCY